MKRQGYVHLFSQEFILIFLDVLGGSNLRCSNELQIKKRIKEILCILSKIFPDGLVNKAQPTCYSARQSAAALIGVLFFIT